MRNSEVILIFIFIKESLENPSIITCYWITSTRAKIWCVIWWTQVIRVELLEEKKEEELKKEVPKAELKESTTPAVPTSIDEYFVETKRSIDNILNGLLEVKY